MDVNAASAVFISFIFIGMMSGFGDTPKAATALRKPFSIYVYLHCVC